MLISLIVSYGANKINKPTAATAIAANGTIFSTFIVRLFFSLYQAIVSIELLTILWGTAK
ncbi:unknown [Coprobacillus sp. CAG:183]|nr:unknown [Coprobacillus sp. CAG:183]